MSDNNSKSNKGYCILARSIQESVMIINKKTGETLKITVMSTNSDRTRLGFLDNEKNFIFIRKEIYDELIESGQSIETFRADS